MKPEDKINEAKPFCGNTLIDFTVNGVLYMATVNDEGTVIWLDRIEIMWHLTRGTNKFDTPERRYRSVSLRSDRAARVLAKFAELHKAWAWSRSRQQMGAA